MRIFVAVALVPALREAIGGLRFRLNSAASSLRWVPPDNLHFTLKFLGEIGEAGVGRVADAARGVAERTKRFEIMLAGLGAFPSPRRPQVVWVGVGEGADRLIALARDLDAALHRLKFPLEDRPFQPHLTVARVRRAGPVPDLSGPLHDLDGMILGTQTVEALLVMESTLKPSGATYRPLDTVWLREVP